MTTTKDPTTQTVDMAILDVVKRAATARLEKVRAAEQAEGGVAKTVLADVGRAALTRWLHLADSDSLNEWEPRRTPVMSREQRGELHVYECALCPVEFVGSSPSEARGKARGHSATHTTPFRFSMDKTVYEQLKTAIHAAGTSVAAVVQDGLEKFARTGEM